jgi:tetratricopeptide (TPR) repeat protein
MIDNYYHILGLDNFSSPQEIKIAYRQILNNPDKKEKFDDLLKSDRLRSSLVDTKYKRAKPEYTKYEYSRKTWIYGSVLILALILLTVVLPIGLMYKASNYSYNQGLIEYKKGNISEALTQYNYAITYWGERAGEASIKGARISIDELGNPNKGLYFIQKGQDHVSNKTFLSELFYLKARALKLKGDYKKSRSVLFTSDSLHYNKDSIQLQLGVLNAFYLHEYAEGLQNFEYLIILDTMNYQARFGKGWCEQKLNNHKAAVETFQKLIESNKADPATYYYTGISKVVLGDTISACLDFKQALNKGYKLANKEIIKNCISIN